MPPITIFCPFTRRWAVDDWLAGLALVEHNPANTNLCIIVDCDEPYIANTIKKFAERHGYRSFHMKMNEGWHPNETRLVIRRQRVAEVHNQSKDLIAMTDGEIIIGLEDDTVFDRVKTFDGLILPLLNNDDVGYVEGVQVGRWGANIIGAWEFDDAVEPRVVKTLLPGNGWNGYQPITAGGWYGYATRRFQYLNCEYYSATSEPWGPDVNYGRWLNQQGYGCFIDWQTVFGHRDYNKVIYPDDPKLRLSQVIFTKDTSTGKWGRTDYERDNF